MTRKNKKLFDRKDEQKMTEQFEDLIGRVRAEQLLQIWKNSYPLGTRYEFLFGKGKTRVQVFEEKAKQEGFTDEEIIAFQDLQ